MQRPLTHSERLIAAGLKRPRQRRPDNRPSPAARGYDAAWRRLAKAYLARHRQCARCGAPATVAGHVVPLPRGSNHQSNLIALCHGCNLHQAHADRAYQRPPAPPTPHPTQGKHPTRFLAAPVGTAASPIGTKVAG